jgi:hypothetical protein
MERLKTTPSVKTILPARTLLETKLKAFHEFMSATAMLMEGLDKESTTEIEHLIEQREVLIGKIDRIDGEIIACVKGKNFSFDAEPALESLVRSISEVARRASRIDDRCRRTLADRLDTLRNEISRTSNSVRQADKYRENRDSSARFFDIKT